MNETTIWWILTGVLVAMELMSGTFYLLMLAIGAAAAALAAQAGAGLSGQLVTAAVVGGLAVILWGRYRQHHNPSDPASAQDLHLDIGETVQVQAWDAEGSTQVKHRGALWAAVSAPGPNPEPGIHRIEAISGSRLVLKKI
jgi:membrane protein implicated in regulation of membrane protease activity